MSIPEILHLESQLRKESHRRNKSATGAQGQEDGDLSKTPISTRKRLLAATIQKMEFIDSSFTGKLVISFKEGGVSYIEKTEQFK